MESHSHSDYEETFRRIATVLDVVAEAQAEQAKAQAEQGRRLDRLVETVEQLSKKVDQYSADTRAELATLSIRSVEHEAKLNALIDMFQQHMREHLDNQ